MRSATLGAVRTTPLVAQSRLDVGTFPSIEAAAALTPERVLELLDTGPRGLTSAEVAERSAVFGPNAVRSHHTSALSVLARQVSSPLLWEMGSETK